MKCSYVRGNNRGPVHTYAFACVAAALALLSSTARADDSSATNLFLGGFFPIGVFAQPQESFAKWKGRGINTILENPSGSDRVSWDSAARSAGLRVIRRPLYENNPAADIGNTNLLAWSHYDEPDAAGRIFTWTPMFETTYASWRSIDPTRTIFINFAGPDLSYFCSHTDTYSTNYASYYPRLIATADWIANDLYPCAGWLNTDHAPRRGDVTLIGEPIRILKTDARLRTTKPQFCFIETSEIEYGNVAGARCPTASEVRAEIWYAIICGVRGLFYFPAVVGVNGFQFDGTPAAIVTEMTNQNATVTQLAPVLQGTVNPPEIGVTAASPLAAGWRKTSDASYFFVLNTRSNAVAGATVRFTGIGDATNATVLKESRSVTLAGGTLTDSFASYAVHIYVVSNSIVPPVTPTGFSATPTATNRIELAWMDNATNETGYVVDRSIDSNNWIRILVSAPNATNCSDTGLVTDSLYHYRVAASNAAGLSACTFTSAATLSAYEAWRRTNFTPAQLADTDISGATADPDGDGMINDHERLAGTSPTNRLSCLALLNEAAESSAPGKFVIRWQSAPGKLYLLQMATNLMNPGFTDYVTNIQATPMMNVYTDTVSSTVQRFYRIKLNTAP